jgi:hypothetical protein
MRSIRSLLGLTAVLGAVAILAGLATAAEPKRGGTLRVSTATRSPISIFTLRPVTK